MRALAESIVAPPPEVLAALVRAGEKYEVPIRVLVSLAWLHGAYDPAAIDTDGRTTLVGLQPQIARSLGMTDLQSIEQGAEAGAKYLALLMRKFGGYKHALGAWRWGAHNVSNNMDPQKWPDGVMRFALRVRALSETVKLPFWPGLEIVHNVVGDEGIARLREQAARKPTLYFGL